MSPWPDLRKPARLNDRSAARWFARIADDLLNRTRWVIGGRPHRITEVEFYFRDQEHDDPFTHGDPVQVHAGRWYFHRTSGVYRAGSFKGVDVTFGDGVARGGILLRGVVAEDGQRIDGPSLLVDHVLTLCRQSTVPNLDREIGDLGVNDRTSPMFLEPTQDREQPILATARVGLTLRRAGTGSSKPAYLTRPYRFLTEPRSTAKGKAQMVMALHRAGREPRVIREQTGTPARSIAAYIEEYEAGRLKGRFEEFLGQEIGPREVCRLHGIADQVLRVGKDIPTEW